MSSNQFISRKRPYYDAGGATQRSVRPRFSKGRPAVSKMYSRDMVKEKKGVDIDIDVTSNLLSTTNTNGGAFLLNPVQQGTGSWNRVGRKTFGKSVRLTGLVKLNVPTGGGGGVDGQEGTCVRMVVVWDKQPCSGTQPTFDDIFGRTDEAGTESCQYLDGVRYDETGRFSVLRDCHMVLNPESNNQADPCIFYHAFDEYIKLGNKESIYSATANPMTTASVSSGALYVYFRQNPTSLTSRTVTIDQAVARFRYTD